MCVANNRLTRGVVVVPCYDIDAIYEHFLYIVITVLSALYEVSSLQQVSRRTSFEV